MRLSVKKSSVKTLAQWALVGLLALFPLAGQAETPASGPLVPLRVANLGIGLASMPQQMALEKGIFAAHGLDPQVINFAQGGAEASAGAASGQVDMGVFGTPILTGISFGLPIKIVAAPPAKGNNFELVARKGIESVKDLKGKVVASGALGGGSHQSLLKILHDNGLSESDLTIIPNGGADAEMILRSGRVDAVVTSEAIRLKLIDSGIGTLIARARDYYGRYEHGYVFATNAFIKSHPEAIRGYLAATRESLLYAQSHLDELVDYSAARVKMKKDLIRTYFEEQFALWDLSFVPDEEGTEHAFAILKDLKEIKPNAVFDRAGWFDLRFLN